MEKKKITPDIPVSNLLLTHPAGLLFSNDTLYLLMKDSLFLDLQTPWQKIRLWCTSQCIRHQRVSFSVICLWLKKTNKKDIGKLQENRSMLTVSQRSSVPLYHFTVTYPEELGLQETLEHLVEAFPLGILLQHTLEKHTNLLDLSVCW